MAGESILVVDDTPVNLKLTRILLVNEGYKVLTAQSGEEALELLHKFHPHMVLADIQLPGIDGLELTRRLKGERKLQDISVVALTAFAMPGDEQKAIDAGCDGYISKPIDTRSLGARIREFLERRMETLDGPLAPPVGTRESSIPAAELHSLRSRFLAEGREQAQRWLIELDGDFNANDAARAVHQWIGAAGLLGYSAVARMAREAESIMAERPVDQSQLRECLTNLALAFNSPRDARDAPVPEPIQRELKGRRIALVGLPAGETQRLWVALERAGAEPLLFQSWDDPSSEVAAACDLAVVHVRPDSVDSAWFTSERHPLLLVGSRNDLLGLDQKSQRRAREILMDAWQPEEALVRISLALHAPAGLKTTVESETAGVRPRVVVADDDSTVVVLLRAALQNFGMECRTASDGGGALDLIRRARPHAAVLDVNMPSLDGFEVLAAIRSEGLPVRVLLLTARQQEGDVLRGFGLGADDYVVKPFSPLELVARVKRLLRK